MVEAIGILKAGILAILLAVLLVLYIGRRKKDYLAVLSAVFLSIPGIMWGNTELMPTVFLGSAFTAIVLGREISIFYTLLLYIYTGTLGFMEKKEGIFFLITGVLISILIENVKKKRLFFYSLLIIFSADIILLLISSDLSMTGFGDTHPVVMAVLTVVSIILGSMAGDYYKRQITLPKTDEPKTAAQGIEVLLNEDFELYRLLKADNKLYHHAEKIAVISERAAGAAGLNGSLAKAGGFYHEIGRLKGKDYVSSGVAIAKEYQLPESIINIIESHSLKLDKPSSPEGAVVMFTVSLVSAVEYFQTSKGHKEKDEDSIAKLMRKFTENLFAMRLEKDSLAKCNLTVNQYIRLKEFYMDYFGNEEE